MKNKNDKDESYLKTIQECFKENNDYLFRIDYPAFIVKKTSQMGKVVVGSDIFQGKMEVGGCVIAWNKQFEELTNFMPSDIDYKYCHDLFRGVWEYCHGDEKDWLEVCYEQCDIRASNNLCIVNKLCINSKDKRGGDIKRKVNVYIFPFTRTHKDDTKKFALHILEDRQEMHSLSYFDSKVQEEGGLKKGGGIEILKKRKRP